MNWTSLVDGGSKFGDGRDGPCSATRVGVSIPQDLILIIFPQEQSHNKMIFGSFRLAKWFPTLFLEDAVIDF